MEAPFELAEWLTGDKVKDAATLTTILDAVRNTLRDDQELRQKVLRSVSVRNQRKRDHLGALSDYQGPEQETVNLLMQNCQQWLRDPAVFWQTPTMPNFGQMMPEAQIVGCYISRDRSDRLASVEEITTAINNSRLLSVDAGEVNKYVSTMIQRGSYYRNLDKVLGAGATLAFGTKIAETSWTRALGKSGERFDFVIDHLRETSLAQLAQDYAGLRTCLVDYQLQILETSRPLDTWSDPMESIFFAEQEGQSSEMIFPGGDMLLDCVDSGVDLGQHYWNN